MGCFIGLSNVVFAINYTFRIDTGRTPSAEVQEAFGAFLDDIAIFQPSSAFSKNRTAFIVGLDALLNSNLGEEYHNGMEGVKMLLPGIAIGFDKAYTDRISLGLTAAVQWWQQPVFDYNYLYYVIAMRGLYHFNATPQIDPYGGLSLGYRTVRFWNDDYVESNNLTSLSLILGCRYFLKDKKWGFFTEFGSDGISQLKIGIVYSPTVK